MLEYAKWAGKDSNSLEKAVICWNNIEQTETSLIRLGYAGIGWNRLRQAGIGWNRLESVRTGWNMLEQALIGWNWLE